jgi:6-phosphogluconate dehydrogenase
MEIGVIGLGRMGGNITRRLMEARHRCVVFDTNSKPRATLAKAGATAVHTMEALAYDHLDPIFATLAPGVGDIPRTAGREEGDRRAERGYIHVGPSGAGHFVKMVHNGIEYGLMQAYAGGFDVLRSKGSGELREWEHFILNLPDIAEVWRRGSVISSWLLDLGAAALAKDPQLNSFSGFVHDSGDGRWTIEAATEEAVPVNVLSAALHARFRSRREHTFAGKVLSAMRLGFGGHVEGREPTHPSEGGEGIAAALSSPAR